MALCIHGNEHCPNRRCREDAVERFEREVTGITGDMTLNELFEHVDGDAPASEARCEDLASRLCSNGQRSHGGSNFTNVKCARRSSVRRLEIPSPAGEPVYAGDA